MTSMEQLAHAITSITGVVVFCVAILIWAIIAYLRLRGRLVPFVKELERYCKLLQDTEGEMAFASHIEELDEQIRQSRLLRHQWSEFRETLIDPSPDDPAPRLYNSQSAAIFFSRDNLLGEHVNLRLYNALPNLFTGTGILGTFVGLVAGIYLAGSNLADPDRAQEALSNLLSGASLAFLTSIAGLITSIFFSSREKHWLHRFEMLRQGWVDGLDARLRRVTLEKLSSDMLEESRQQTRFFSDFAEKLAFQLAAVMERTIPKALDETVTAPLTASLEELKEAVKNLANNQQRANEETLQKIVEEFSNTISGAAGKEIQAFTASMKTLGKQMDSQIQEMTKQQEAASRQSAENREALETTFLQASEILRDTVQDISTRLEKTAMSFAETTDGLTGSVQAIRGLLDDTRELVGHLEQLVTSTRNAHAELERVAAGLGEASTETQNAAGIIAEAANQAQETTATLQTALEGFARHQSALQHSWAQYEARFAGLDESLAGTFQQIEQGLERYAQLVHEFITELDGHTGKITSMLAGAVQELNESIEDLSDTLERSDQ